MVFLVHECADIFRVLAHGSALEVSPVSLIFKNKLRGIGQWLCYGYISTCEC